MSQINPNTSRFDKIKKLFHISSELIAEFGLSYFLRIAFRNYHHKKLHYFYLIIPQLKLKMNLLLNMMIF